MKFKKGDVVYVSSQGLEAMSIPQGAGNMFKLNKKKDNYWIMDNNYIVLEKYIEHTTDLIKALY
jgi:hypothetical protein